MRRLGVIVIFMVSSVLAQTGLTDDQEALLADVQAAFNQADAWQTYRQSIEETTSMAYTLADAWASEVTLREMAIDVNREQGVGGSIFYTQNVLSSVESMNADTTRQAEFVMNGEDVVLTEDDDITETTLDALVVSVFGLSELEEMTDTEILLDNVTAVYDLGVRNRQGVAFQQYQLDLDILSSLPSLNVDLTTLSRQFGNALSQSEFLNLMEENGTLTLHVVTNQETGELISTDLLLDIPLEVQVNESDLLQLEFSYRVVITYHDVGAEIEIPEIDD